MTKCSICCPNSYYRKNYIQLVTDEELQNPVFIQELRQFTSDLKITSDAWPDFICDLYRDFNGFIQDSEGNSISLNTEHLEIYPEWYRDWVNTPVKTGAIPRVRREAKARIRILATILKTRYPEIDQFGSLDAENDN